MPNNVGLALGTMAGVFGQHFAQQKQQAHDDEQNRIKLITGMVQSGLASGTIANPNEAFQYLLGEMGAKGAKSKPGQPGSLPPQLQMVLGATQQAAPQGGGSAPGQPQSTQTLGGQARPSFGTPASPGGTGAPAPSFLTPEQRDAAATAHETALLKIRGDMALKQSLAVKQAELDAEAADKAKELGRHRDEWIASPDVQKDFGGDFRSFLEERGFFKAIIPKPPTPEKDISPDPNSPTGWSRKYLNRRGEVERIEAAPAPKEATKNPVRSHLVGEALQAYDMNQMMAGIDPETSKVPEDPADVARLKAAGKSMETSRNLKNQNTTVRIENIQHPNMTGEALQSYVMQQLLAGQDPKTGKVPTDPAQYALLTQAGKTMQDARKVRAEAAVARVAAGKAKDEDIKEVATDVAEHRTLPSAIGAMGSGRISIMAEANRIRRADGLEPLNYTKMQLDYYAAQRAIASLKGPQMTRFEGLATGVVKTLEEVNLLGNALKQGSIQKWNEAKRGTLLQLYGNTPESATAARYLVALNTLKEEFASLAQGGYAPTEAAWKLANDQINGNFGVKDLHSSLDEVKRLIMYRQDAFSSMMTNAMAQGIGGGPAAPPAIAPPPPAVTPGTPGGFVNPWAPKK